MVTSEVNQDVLSYRQPDELSHGEPWISTLKRCRERHAGSVKLASDLRPSCSWPWWPHKSLKPNMLVWKSRCCYFDSFSFFNKNIQLSHSGSSVTDPSIIYHQNCGKRILINILADIIEESWGLPPTRAHADCLMSVFFCFLKLIKLLSCSFTFLQVKGDFCCFVHWQ